MADDGRPLRRRSTLVMRNVRVGARRTSLRLESAVWEALGDIAEREGVPLNRLLTRIAGGQSESSFTASVRVYALGYYRGLARRLEGV
jgi:predicted DNA-binding ribbon-helix-helix protein